jgi:CheY-like chemotaxis protein
MGAELKVLVVDDNQDAADSLALLLTLEGHAATAIYEPHEALALTASSAPDVILLDIGLPGMDGYEVARRLRAQGVPSRLVALSGYGQQEDIDRAMAAGFDEHMAKPVDWAKLEQMLRKMLTHELA